MQNGNTWMNRFTTPCEENAAEQPERGKRRTKKQRRRGRRTIDLRQLHSKNFISKTCLKCITSFQFIRNNRKLLDCPKYEKVSIEGMLLDNLLNHR